MIDYYFETGEFSTEDKITHIPKCNMCDNCRGTKKQDVKDLSEETKVVVRVIQSNCNKIGHALGMEKTIALIKKDNDAVFRGKSKKWIRDVVDVLASKDIVERRTVGSYGGMVIDIGKAKLSDCLPVMARIDEDVSTKSKYFVTVDSKFMRLTRLRDEMAKKHGIVPAMFMNDRVLMNISDKSPKNIKELWSIDGISDEFVMTYGDEFMEGFLAEPAKTFQSFKSKPAPRKTTAKQEILSHYREGKSIEEIAKCRQVSNNTVEGHLLSIMETENVDIDPDYFGLTEEYEEEIKRAIGRIGSERLSPIKECVNPSISYTQIKLCILIIRIEGDE